MHVQTYIGQALHHVVLHCTVYAMSYHVIYHITIALYSFVVGYIICMCVYMANILL